jgi:hypothetical protein
MNEFLKGNFKVKRPVTERASQPVDERQRVAEELKQRALTSLGGSMVYVERTSLTWDGDENGEAAQVKQHGKPE